MITVKGIAINQQDGTITHRGKTAHFIKTGNRRKFNLAVYFLLAGGASKEMAFWHLYGDDPEGGPDSGTSGIQVAMNHLATESLSRIGVEFRSWRIAGVTYYEIVPTFELTVPNRFSHRVGKHIARSGQPINSRGLPV